MAGAAPGLQATGGINDVMNLLGLVKGTGSSQTTSSNVSSTGVQELIQQILQGNQGLAAVAGGQKSAGLYGSSTNQMMINDLITQTAAKTAVAQAGSTTKTSKPAMFGGQDLLTLLAAYSANKVLGPTVKKAGSKLGLDDIGDKLAESLGLGSSGGPVGSAIPGAGGELSLQSNAAIGVDTLGNATAGASLAGGGSGLAGVGGALGADGILIGAGETSGLLAAANATADPLGAFIGSLGFDVSAAGAGSAAATAAGAAEVAGAAEAATAATTAIEGAGIVETIGTWLATLFSDRRLKFDIKEVGALASGQKIYTFKYLNDPNGPTHMGVMAQESPVEIVKNDYSTGYLKVDYSKFPEVQKAPEVQQVGE